MGRIGEAKSEDMEEAAHVKQAPLGRQALGLQNTEPGGNLPSHLKTDPFLHRGETEAKRVQVASPRSLLQSGL